MTASAKAFYADLACVRKSEFEHVSAIRRGDSDGEITFKYSNTTVGEPLEIQVVATGMFFPTSKLLVKMPFSLTHCQIYIHIHVGRLS